MISGEYKHNIDTKNRLILPVKLREALGDNVIMTKSVDRCIALYPSDSWAVFTDKINALPEMQSRKIKRYIYSSAVEAEPDSQGRILLPLNLRVFAGIDKNVTVVGVGDHAEIWDDELWNEEVNSGEGDDIAGQLINLGF